MKNKKWSFCTIVSSYGEAYEEVYSHHLYLPPLW